MIHSPLRNRAPDHGAALPPAVIDRNRALLLEAESHVYKTAGETKLEVHVFKPQELKEGDLIPRPAVAFFYSSGWDSGLLSQFAPHCMHFSHRGAVAFLFDYRVSSRHNSTPRDSMADARSAIRWIRMNAEALGIDPSKIIAAGGAAGAQIALSAAMLEGFDDEGDDLSIPCCPDALLLFNPILDTTRKGSEAEKFTDKKDAKAASPIHHCRKRLPPMMLFHGTLDRVVPYETSRKFVRKLRWRGNDCKLTTYEGCGHGFYNFNVDAGLYELTLNVADAFLVERGFLAPEAEPDTSPRLVNY
jgi:acetyl esterase